MDVEGEKEEDDLRGVEVGERSSSMSTRAKEGRQRRKNERGDACTKTPQSTCS